MRIAMIGQKGMPAKYGGVERHVHELSVRLVELGHDVTVYSRPWYTDKTITEFEGVNIQSINSIHTKHLDAITHTLVSTIHAICQNYDIIHYHGVGPALLSWIPRIFSPKTKVISTFHCIDRYHQKWNWFARLILRIGERATCTFAHKTITVSKSLKQYCFNEFNVETKYIPNGVSKQTKPEGNKILNDFGLEKEKYLLMVSRLVPHKGAHLLVEAFSNLKINHKEDSVIRDLKLVIVGGSAYTDDYVHNLHKQAGVCNDIIFTDYQSGENLRQFFGNCFSLVHPSMNEGLPITVLEAMSYSKPVLVSDIPEHLELIQDIRAIIFNKNDVQSIESKIYEFLHLPEEEREKIGRRNLKNVEKNYSWEIVVPQIDAVYNIVQPNKVLEYVRTVV